MPMRSNKDRRPIRSLRRTVVASRDAGSRRGDLALWLGRQVASEKHLANERLLIQRRASDLAANDWVAESLLSTLQHNVIGSGLAPSVRLPSEKLGLSPEQSLELGKRFEWMFYRWSLQADLYGRSSFGELQFLMLRTMLSMGEAVHLPVMLSESERIARGVPYSLCVQAVSPSRLRTPSEYENSPNVHDGILFDEYGRPVEYYIATPSADGTGALLTDQDNTQEFSIVPARIGHRPGILHLFVQKDDEQIRGESIFANSANLFRYIDDAIAYELQAQNMSAKFSIVMTREESYQPMDGVSLHRDPETGQEQYYSDVDGAGILYANPGEKPEVIKSDRPSNNWASLIKLALGGVGGSASLSYLAVSKDYSNVNYSSARAAQNGDWKVYLWFREFVARHYCQPFFDMLIEEAYLRGEWEPPAGSPDFYEARDLWCSCMWTGPARGYMDPVKEIEADIKAVDSRLQTRHEVMAANGRDFDDEYPVLLAEHEKMKALDGASNTSAADTTSGNDPDVSPEKTDEEQDNENTDE